MDAVRTVGMTIALLAAPGGLLAQETPEVRVAVQRLELDLSLDYDEGSLAGSASYALQNTSDRPASEVAFNLGRLMTVRAAHVPDGPDLGFTQEIAVFTDAPRRQVNHVIVSLPEPLAPGARTTLRLEYGGYLVGYTETGAVYIQDRVVWNAVARYRSDGTFSILRADAYAWPVPETLTALRNRAAPRPDFDFRAAITVPEPYVVASGGRLVQRTTTNGRTTWVYESVAPVPFLNLPIADYAVRRGHGIRVYHFPADSAGGRRVLQRAEAGLELLARWFGPQDSLPDVTVMEIPQVWGSQASLTGGIIQTADVFGASGSLGPLYHELSHLWNVPDLDQPSARWNEGLAMFLQLRMAEVLDGSDEMAGTVRRMADRLVSGGYPVLTGVSQTAAARSVPFSQYGAAGLTGLSYPVGCLMFHALYTALGADVFDEAVGGYFQANKGRGGTFDGLMEAFQARTSRDLGPFFQTWVYSTDWIDQLTAGVPVAAIGFGA